MDGQPHQDVAATLGALERKLRQLEQELENAGRNGEVDADPAQGGWTPESAPPPPAAAGPLPDTGPPPVPIPLAGPAPVVAEWQGGQAPPPAGDDAFAGAALDPRVPGAPAPPPDGPPPQPPDAAPIAPRAAGLDGQLDELLQLRDRFVAVTGELVGELTRVLADLGATGEPDLDATLLDGHVTLEAGPVPPPAPLAALARAGAPPPGGTMARVRSPPEGRAPPRPPAARPPAPAPPGGQPGGAALPPR